MILQYFRRFFPLLIYSFIQFGAVSAQNSIQPSFRNYSVKDGLPSSEVYDVMQDSKGYLWFATDMGPSRYNGYEFKNFSLKDGLPDNTILKTFEDHKGRIWFISLSGQLVFYDKGKIYPFPYNDNIRKLFKIGLCSFFHVDKQDNVFLGMWYDGYYKISSQGKIIHYVIADSSNHEILQLDSGKIAYISSDASVPVTMNINTEIIKCKFNFPYGTSDNVSEAKSIFTNGKKNILLSYKNALYEFRNCNDFTVIKLKKEQNIISLYQDVNKGLWVGAKQGGIRYFKSGNISETVVPVFLPELSVSGVIKDNEGGYWFTTLEDGVFYTPEISFLTYSASELPYNNIIRLATDGTNVYAGTSHGIIYKISERKTESYNFNGNLNSRIISFLLYDSTEKQLWVTGGGLWSGYINKNGKIQQIAGLGGASNIIKTADGSIWSGSWSGLHRYKNIHEVFNTGNLMRVNAICTADKNSFWIGTMNGLWKFHIPDKEFTYQGDKHPWLKYRILNIVKGRDETLYIATKGGGIVIWNGKDIHQITVTNGLADDNVKKLFLKNNELWAVTNQGLSKIYISDTGSFSYKIENFTSKNGLASDEVNDVLILKNKVWVATNEGLTTFNSEYKKSNYTPPVYITKINISGHDTAVQTKYKLPYTLNNIIISFEGISFRKGKSLGYRYRMEGLNNNWIYTPVREAHFGLPPGNYRFSVAAKGSSGKWGNSKTMLFNITPPIWQTWGFRILILCLIISGAFLYFRARLKRIRAKEHAKTLLNNQIVNLELKALKAQMNPHFVFNVMNSIQHYIAYNDSESAQKYLIKFSRLIRRILDNSELTSISLDEELEVLKLYLELESLRFEENFEYTIQIEEGLDTHAIQIPPLLLQPYVENAIKHGLINKKEKGKISIYISKTGNVIHFTIEDNGIGRKKSKLLKNNTDHKSMGMRITDERLQLFNYLHNSRRDIKITDMENEENESIGTRVEIFIAN